MTETQKTIQKKTAFALGGLAGNNAHGAGFLQAALETGKKPDLISCTSGQIYWVYNYLNALNHQKKSSKKNDTASAEKDPLRLLLQKDIINTPAGPLDLINRMMLGMHGKIEPDFLNYTKEFAMNSWSLVLKNLAHPTALNTLSDFYHLFPSRWLAPRYTKEFYSKISTCFMEEQHIGIFFNSYNPTDGYETIYTNQAGKKVIENNGCTGEKQITYEDITPQAVKDALKLYEYGFDKKTGLNVDGEYFRPIILRELLTVDDIFVVKPCNTKWIGNLPTTSVELADLKTEVGINAIYRAEKSNIELINHLIQKGYLNHVKKYHTVTIHEVEVQSQEGFDDYAIEDLYLFDNARAMGEQLLAQAKV